MYTFNLFIFIPLLALTGGTLLSCFVQHPVTPQRRKSCIITGKCPWDEIAHLFFFPLARSLSSFSGDNKSVLTPRWIPPASQCAAFYSQKSRKECHVVNSDNLALMALFLTDVLLRYPMCLVVYYF